MTMWRMLRTALVIGLVPAAGACGRDETNVEGGDAAPPAAEATAAQDSRVTELDLGRAIDAQGRITGDDTDDFAPGDTIYASVSTAGSAAGSTLTARWTFQDGQVVDETTQTISAAGPAVTEFHISHPSGFPVGEYTVAIQLDGRTVETEEFEVR